MESIEKSYGRDDIVITFEDTDPVSLTQSPKRFKRAIVQADFDNEGNVKIGGENPSIVLIPGASQQFQGGELMSIFVSGAVDDTVNVHYEF